MIQDAKFEAKLLNEIKKLCDKYHIRDYDYDFSNFILFGATAGKFSRRAIREPVFKDIDEKYTTDVGFTVEFTIHRPILKQDLAKWMNENIDIILAEADSRFRGMKPSALTVDNIDRILRIIDLKDNQKKKYKEIADQICKENPNDPDVYDGKVNEGSIRQIYNRYKKRYS